MILAHFWDRLTLPVRYAVFAAIATSAGMGAHADAEVVEYEVTFRALWSRSTHPQDFPPRPHFSGLVGGTHNEDVRFWEVDRLASAGIEQMAELGSKTPLDREIQSAIGAGDAFSLISGGGINPSPGVVSEIFSMSATHSLVTLVSMIAPSPDWFVGVSGLDLRPDGTWVDEIVVELFPYDSGTDTGPRFTSTNDDTNPPEPIRPITGIPFDQTPALGTFAFRRIPPALQPGDADRDLDFDQFDLIEVQRAAKYQTDQPATWGEGDWNGAPGGSPASPPRGDGVFDRHDIIAALQAGAYLTGPYAARRLVGQREDLRDSLTHDARDDEVAIETGSPMSSHIGPGRGVFHGDPAQHLGRSLGQDNPRFKRENGATLGPSAFGTVTRPGPTEEFSISDMGIVGSVSSGRGLGEVDLVYVPEPTSALLLALGLALVGVRRVGRGAQCHSLQH